MDRAWFYYLACKPIAHAQQFLKSSRRVRMCGRSRLGPTMDQMLSTQ